MKRHSLWLNMMLLLALLLPGAEHLTAATLPEDDGAALIAIPAAAGAGKTLYNSPVMFIENVGQFAGDARFQVRGAIGTLWLADDALWITVVEPSVAGEQREANPAFGQNPKYGIENRQIVNLRLSFPDANPNARLETFDRLETTVSYFLGNDPDGWRPAVPVWGGVRYVDLYPGVDLEVTGENGQFVQRLNARPGADLSQVKVRIEGAEAVELTATGSLRLSTAVGDYTLPLLAVGFAPADARTMIHTAETGVFDIAAPFAVRHSSFTSHNPQSASQNQDGSPALLYSTFLGGNGWDFATGIAVDGVGNVYITGQTYSIDFPATVGPNLIYNGNADAFVAKVNIAGTGLVYAGFLGGGSSDYGVGISVDEVGNAYVVGTTGSADFPTSGGPDLTHNGNMDIFVAKVNAAGTGLVYAGFLGGSSDDYGVGIAVDGAGNAYVTGDTSSFDFPAIVGPGLTYNGGFRDAFVAKVDADGTGLVYAGFLGGSSEDRAGAIAVDGAGNAYVVGSTGSLYFPTTVGPDLTHNGIIDAFIAKINAAGTGLVYAGFLGGSDVDFGFGIAVDGAGNAYVVGQTNSSDFPATIGPDLTYNGGGDVFVAKVNAAGTGLVYAGFLGGSAEEGVAGIAVDGAGNSYITGYTNSIDFPATVGPDLLYNGGENDAFVVKINAAGTGLIYASFLGGSSSDLGEGIAVDDAGNAYVAGLTNSIDFPTTPGTFGSTHNDGEWDAFVAKVGLAVTSAISGQVTGAGGDAISDVLISAGTGYTATTDNSGNYSLAGLTPGTYTLTPTKADWVFIPPTRTVSLPPDATGQNFTMLHPPVSVTLSLSGTVNLPASLSYVDTQGLTTTVMFPAGAVTATTTIVLTPTLPIAGSDLAFAGHAFNMEAYQDGVWQPDFTFETPVLVTIHYSQQDVRLISDKSQLVLYRWEDSAWADAACDAYTRQLPERWLSAPLCRLSHFALFGPTHRIYLPLVMRSQWAP